MLRPVIVALLCITALAAVSPGVADADGDFAITVENGEVDVPDRTTQIAGQEFTITSIAPVEPGEAIDVRVSTSGDDPYDIFLYNSDGVPDGRELGVSGETTVTFETTDLDPGTYSVVVSTDRFETVQPVVITAYETTLSAPSTVTEGEDVSIGVETTEHDSVDAPAIERVGVVLANDSAQYRIEASETGDGTYVADVSADYEPGEYRLYGVVYEDEEVQNGELNVISMSDEHTVTVAELEGSNQNETDADAEGSNGSGGTPSAGPGTDGETEDPAENATDDTEETYPGAPENGTDGPTENGTGATTDDGTDGPTENGTGATTENGTGATTDDGTDPTDENGTDGQPIQPNGTDDVAESSDSVPLNGVQIIVVSLLAIGSVARLRHGRER